MLLHGNVLRRRRGQEEGAGQAAHHLLGDVAQDVVPQPWSAVGAEEDEVGRNIAGLEDQALDEPGPYSGPAVLRYSGLTVGSRMGVPYQLRSRKDDQP